MGIVTLWIVTEDMLAAGRVQLGGLTSGIEIHLVSHRDWRSGDVPCCIPDAILFDLPDASAWEQVPHWAAQRRNSELARYPWIAITDQGIPLPWAVAADQTFAGFMSAPFSRATLERTIALARKRLIARGLESWGESRTIRGSTRDFTTYEPALFSIVEQLKLAAGSDFTILLVAETGTGKSTLAQIVHENSRRRNHRFLSVPCASMSRELIESEFFGHVKGAFTGAERAKEGKFDVAQGGTILLDEIDALETMQQAKMLRVLETGEYEPVGSNDTRRSTARCIIASNVCLEKLVAAGKFRSDLFYRLNQLKFEIPPLRQRPRDIIPIAVELLRECAQECGSAVQEMDVDLYESLLHYSWPGNVRELRNELRRCMLYANKGVLQSTSLSPAILATVAKICDQAHRIHSPIGLAGNVALTEQQTIESMLRNQNFNRAATARALGISRVTLYNKLRRYNIQVDDAEKTP